MRETYGSTILDFVYNADGSLYSFRVNGTYYYYVTNLQGDVIGLVDANGNTVASYEYDPYGDLVSATGDMAAINPMRYRGYYYDTETTLYYLQSRYYDPELGRFINPDAYASTGQGVFGNNMFAYCLNDPVNNFDPRGNYAGDLTANGGRGFSTGNMGAGYGGDHVVFLEGLLESNGELITTGVSLSITYAYRQYTKFIKKTNSSMQSGNYPVTHHIIPYGQFSTRSDEVQAQLKKAQEIMINAKVYPKYDPINQMTLSASYHISLHTDSYILMVTGPIIALGENPTKEEIYDVLYYLRLNLAASDPFALDY